MNFRFQQRNDNKADTYYSPVFQYITVVIVVSSVQ